jgi:metacaspase-1
VSVSNRLTGIVKEFKPALILISGCQDNQFSMDGDHNGAFTEQLLRVWNNGAFKGSYASFHAHIRAGLPPSQSPNLFTLGPAAPFLKQAPFSV